MARRSLIILTATAVSCLMIAAGATAIIVLVHVTKVDPENFEAANRRFFQNVAAHELVIVDSTIDKELTETVGQWTIRVEAATADSLGPSDRRSKRHHANEIVLIFACHELLAGDRQLAMRLLDLLGTHDPGLRYDYASIETDASDGYPNRFITIDQLREAASKLVAGDPRGKALLEEPASQLKLRLKRYGPARIPGADRARGQGPLTTAPIPVTANRYLVGSKSRPSAA